MLYTFHSLSGMKLIPPPVQKPIQTFSLYNRKDKSLLAIGEDGKHYLTVPNDHIIVVSVSLIFLKSLKCKKMFCLV